MSKATNEVWTRRHAAGNTLQRDCRKTRLYCGPVSYIGSCYKICRTIHAYLRTDRDAQSTRSAVFFGFASPEDWFLSLSDVLCLSSSERSNASLRSWCVLLQLRTCRWVKICQLCCDPNPLSMIAKNLLFSAVYSCQAFHKVSSHSSIVTAKYINNSVKQNKGIQTLLWRSILPDMLCWPSLCLCLVFLEPCQRPWSYHWISVDVCARDTCPISTEACSLHDTDSVIEGDPDFLATHSTGHIISTGEAKVKNQIHTRQKDQYFTLLSSKHKPRRQRVAHTAAQLLKHEVSSPTSCQLIEPVYCCSQASDQWCNL